MRRAASRVGLIARTELRRRVRAIKDNPKQLVGLLLGGVFALLPLAASVGGAYFLGAAFRTGEAAFDALGLLGSLAGGAFAVFAFIVGIRLAQNRDVLDEPEGVLVAVDHREATAGAALAEFAGGVGVFSVAAGAAGVAFAVGARRPASALLVAAAFLSPALLGSMVGFAGGIGVRLAVSRVEVLARVKTALGLAVALGYFWFLVSSPAESPLAPVMTALAETPLGWFAHLALLGVAPGAAVGRALAAAGVVLVGVPALFYLTTLLTAELWFGDAVTAGRDEGGDADRRRVGARGLSRFDAVGGLVSRPTLRTAQKSWLRARRAPITLSYVLYPMFFLYVPVRRALSGSVTATVAASVAVYLAWAAGAAFTLNPLGDEGAALPTTLTTPVRGRQFVGGRCLVGVVLGAPAAALGAGGAAVLADASPAVVVALAAFGGALAAAATGVAAGAGTAFPKFETTRISRSRRAVLPGLVAFAVYSVGLLAVAAPGAAAAVPVVRRTAADLLGVGTTAVVVGGVGFSAVLAGVAGLAAAAYAVRRFDAYEMS